ncbi:hypothetical protein D910_02934 [Dendroctonus ponderosae]|uniref:RHD domain-containing protein n=1 Tax=Dendroctonus ponderosae TaxID=77166 RepID=U4U6D2_DENPD|nr:hypothetical protein D910_02934 [Dendroctonus ponderosae]
MPNIFRKRSISALLLGKLICYRVHPHNLVGKDCKNGVCTVVIAPETMRAQFQNLGIQCVKKRDIESSLRQRENIKVDPFRQGYSHRSQPTSIDLNAVRLCFQTYLEEDGKFIIPLRAVVSDVIYDKKAMADLSIVQLCSCVSHVAKEDVEIHFYEEDLQGNRVWQAKADFQPSQVHKQTAISFKVPPYRTLDVSEPVRVYVQLYRPSDRLTSEPRPFEYLPLDSGRPPYWSFKRGLSKKANYDLFDSILATDAKLAAKRQLSVTEEAKAAQVEANNNSVAPSYAEVKKSKLAEDVIVSSSSERCDRSEEKSFNEIINQVAELDEIYADTHAKLLNEALKEIGNEKPPIGQTAQEESFDDARTYTSLQLAFKNPVPVKVASSRYEDVIITPLSPQVEVAPTAPKAAVPKPTLASPPIVPPKSSNFNGDGVLPPLPPKRTKKLETYIGGSMSSIQLTGKQADILLTRSGSMKSASVSRTQSFNLQRPKSHAELAPPGKHLPPVPNASATLPNPKKRGFFSKLFGRRSSKSSVRAPSREPSVTPSYNSSRSLQVENVLAKSSGNISTYSSNSIRIRLKDESPPPITGPDSFSSLQAPITTMAPSHPTPDEDMDVQLDLTEAENYALYTSMAPHATQSEFDEFSCYYAPVEGGKLLTNAEAVSILAGKT